MNNNEIVSERTVNFPIKKVWEARTNTQILHQWWGPYGFTNECQIHELKVGGKWEFIMKSAEGTEFQNKCVYTKIEEPNLLMWNHENPPFVIITRFEDIGRTQTNIHFTMQFDSEELCDIYRKFVPEKNEENFDRLEQVLS